MGGLFAVEILPALTEYLLAVQGQRFLNHKNGSYSETATIILVWLAAGSLAQVFHEPAGQA